MKIASRSDRVLEATSLVGIVAGIGALLPAFFMPEMGFLVAPAFVVLLSGLLYGMR